MSITDVKGIGQVSADMLRKHGFHSAEDLASTSLTTLIRVPGFSRLRAQQVIRDAKAISRHSKSSVVASKPVKTKKKPTKKQSDKKSKKSGSDKKDKAQKNNTSKKNKGKKKDLSKKNKEKKSDKKSKKSKSSKKTKK